MDKLAMAHEWYMKNSNGGSFIIHDVKSAWQYADAMQAEADKREVGIAELMKDHVHDYIYGRICACGAVNGAEKEWQPDWSQAPSWANWWAMDDCDYFWWYEKSPEMKNGGWCVSWTSDDFEKAPSFNYQGNWQESLRKRPQ